ncbi:MAG TPA: hypothetical protein PKE20_11475, partial [Promineifilum sp.]|nr:hypothetical protein [Promineifilum sp.]
MSYRNMSADPQPPPSRAQRLTTNPALLALGIIALLVLLAACVMGFLLLRPLVDEQGGGEGGPPAAGAPTPFPQGTPGSAGQPIVVGVSDSGTFSVTLDAPNTLDVLDKQWVVMPQNIGVDGLWNPEIDEASAAWINGTIVNHVLGLAGSEANRALLEGLAPGDRMTITTRQGVTHAFTFDSRAQVPTTDRSIYNQQTPGITLILFDGDAADRLVVRGRYEVAASNPSSGGNVIQM